MRELMAPAWRGGTGDALDERLEPPMKDKRRLDRMRDDYACR